MSRAVGTDPKSYAALAPQLARAPFASAPGGETPAEQVSFFSGVRDTGGVLVPLLAIRPREPRRGSVDHIDGARVHDRTQVSPITPTARSAWPLPSKSAPPRPNPKASDCSGASGSPAAPWYQNCGPGGREAVRRAVEDVHRGRDRGIANRLHGNTDCEVRMGPDSEYTAMARRAQTLWHQLERADPEADPLVR